MSEEIRSGRLSISFGERGQVGTIAGSEVEQQASDHHEVKTCQSIDAVDVLAVEF
jgi:hypothetical protein